MSEVMSYNPQLLQDCIQSKRAQDLRQVNCGSNRKVAKTPARSVSLSVIDRGIQRLMLQVTNG